MYYKDFLCNRVSALGLGLMRLPLKTGKNSRDGLRDGDNGAIDKQAVEEMVAYAFEHGINYFDTAWPYHNGNSELVIGEVLKKYDRDSFYLATKFPGFDLGNMPKVKEIFERQLEKCQVEYFDYYLIHNVCESNIDGYLNEEFGILDYMLEQKKAGKIKHFGFSAHGTLDTIKRFMESPFGEHMEFCQLQLNYMDWHFQQCDKKVEYCREKGLPVIVMEPVRGGKLANMSGEMLRELEKLRPEENSVSWAFRFTQSIDDIAIVLSGMSNMQQLKENIATFDEPKALNEKEFETLVSLKDKEIADIGIPCTACNYCLTHCPQGLPIPTL